MKEVKQNLTLDRPATYQIKVPGELDESWSDCAPREAVRERLIRQRQAVIKGQHGQPLEEVARGLGLD